MGTKRLRQTTSVMDAWVSAAIDCRTGQSIARLLQKIGEMALGILTTRQVDRLRTNPALARATQETISQMSDALLAIVAEPDVVATEIHNGSESIHDLSYGASGEAGAFQPVRDRSGKGVANHPVASVAQASVTATVKRTQ